METDVYGTLSPLGCGGRMSSLVTRLSWAGAAVSFSSLVAGTAVLSLHLLDTSSTSLTENLQRELREKLQKLNQTELLDLTMNLDEIFYSCYGIFLSLALLWATYFSILIRENRRKNKENVVKLLRLACYFNAIGRIILSPRYALVYLAELVDIDEETSPEEFGILFLTGATIIIIPLDVIFACLVIYNMNKRRLIKIYIIYVMIVFLLRTAIYILYIVFEFEDNVWSYAIPLSCHVFFFAFAYAFLVLHYSFLQQSPYHSRPRENIEIQKIRQSPSAAAAYENQDTTDRSPGPPPRPPKPAVSQGQFKSGGNVGTTVRNFKPPAPPPSDLDDPSRGVAEEWVSGQRRLLERQARVLGRLEEGGQTFSAFIHHGQLHLYLGDTPREIIQLKDGTRVTSENTILLSTKSGGTRKFRFVDKNIHSWNLSFDEAFSATEEDYV